MLAQALSVLILWQSVGGVLSHTNEEGRDLVVLSAPSPSNNYYSDFKEDIYEFQSDLANAIIGRDNVIILGDSDALEYFRGKVPDDILLEAHVDDIWIRDFSTAGPSNNRMFYYLPNYLGKRIAKRTQNSLYDFLAQCGVAPKESDLVLDGGNLVENGGSLAVATTRIYDDNWDLSRAKVKSALEADLGGVTLAVIPEEEGDTTGHSDGMVAFLASDVLAVTKIKQNSLKTAVWAALNDEFGSSVSDTVELGSNYVYEEWRDFSSACGLHINMLATTNHIYVPTFGADPANTGQSARLDASVLSQIRNAAAGKKDEVVEVAVKRVICRMGGSVRCLTWNIKGADADTLVRKARVGHC